MFFRKVAEQKKQLDLNFSPPEAMFAVALAAAAADGVIVDSEVFTIVSYLSRMRLFANFTAADNERLMQKMLGHLNTYGVDGLIAAAKDALPLHLLETAYTLAVDITLADGELTDDEHEMLDELRQALDITPAISGEIIRVMLIKNRG
jgi:tellurite resistance protein